MAFGELNFLDYQQTNLVIRQFRLLLLQSAALHGYDQLSRIQHR
jgi:hypothetical protein